MAKALAPSAGALALGLSVEPRPRGRRLLLRAGAGEVELVLREPLPAAGAPVGPALGSASLARGPADPQGAFVAEAARWLATEPRARPLSTPQAIPVGCKRLGEAGGLEALELTLVLEDRFRAAPAKPAAFRLFLGPDRALLDLASARAKRAAIDALALALWGPLDPLTAAADWDRPLVPEVRPVAGAPFPVWHFAWAGEALVAVASGRPAALLRWADPDAAPERLLEADDLRAVAARRDGSALAAVLQRGGAWEVAVLEGGAARPLLRAAPDFEPAGEPVFSPDGRLLAVGGVDPRGGKRRLLTRAYEVESGRWLGATDPDQDLSPGAWLPDGLRLTHLGGRSGSRTWSVYRWSPGVPDLPREATGVLTSPSGAWTLAKHGVPVARGPGGVARQISGTSGGFEGSLVELMEHQTGHAHPSQWLGERPVLSHGDRFAFDLATGRARRLAPRLAPLHYLGADPAGRRALFETERGVLGTEGQLLWGEVERW